MSKRADGEGTTYRRTNGTWSAQSSFRDENGILCRKSFYGKTEKAVLAKKKAFDRQRDDGLPLSTSRAPTITSYGKEWLRRIEQEVTLGQIRPTTADSYGTTWRTHIEPTLGHHRLDGLRPQHLRGWLAAKAAETSGRGKTLSPRSCQYMFAVLRRALNDAVRDGTLHRNPCEQITGPSGTAQTGGLPLTAAEATAMLTSTRDEPDAALWLLLVSMGLRIGEALALRWSDVDLEGGRLTVARAVSRVRGPLDPQTGKHRTTLVFALPKTKRSAATLAMPLVLVEPLRRHRAAQAQARLRSLVWVDEDLIFPTSIGTAQDTRNVGRRWHEVRDRAGIARPVRLHDLRHSAATFLLAAGVPMRVITETLRHSRYATTADTYTHVPAEIQATAALAMDALLGGLRGEDHETTPHGSNSQLQ